MLSVPTASVVKLAVATPAETGALPSVVDPDWKVTVPLGAPVPVVDPTEAAKVTLLPCNAVGLAVESWTVVAKRGAATVTLVAVEAERPCVALP